VSRTIPSDIVIYSAGSAPFQIPDSSCLTKDVYGRLQVYRTLQTLSRPEVFSLGDCAKVIDVESPSTAAVALQQAAVASANVVRRANLLQRNSEEPKRYLLEKFTYVPLGELLTFGESNGAMSTLNGAVALSGPLAALTRRLVYAYRMPTKDQQLNGLVGTTSKFFDTLHRKSSCVIPPQTK